MNKLLHLKHWQLFVLLVGVPLILQIAFVASMVVTYDPAKVIFFLPVIIILFIGVFFGWFYALGTNLYKKLPESVTMNLRRFKILLVIPMIYFSFIGIFMLSMFNGAALNGEPPSIRMIGMIGLIIPVHLFSIFCIFYCIYFNAKALKAVELQRPVTFSDFAGEFFLIWFFAVGIWFIQPRINKLFNENNGITSNY